MEVPGEIRRELFFRDIERRDIVIGRITSIREFGFFMVLMCLGSGFIRQIDDLQISVRFDSSFYGCALCLASHNVQLKAKVSFGTESGIWSCGQLMIL